MDKIYWFVCSDSPDQAFFKYGDRKPSDRWCMFDNLLSVYKHAYKMMLRINDYDYCIIDGGGGEYECECAECGNKLPDNPTIEDFKKMFEKNDFDYEEFIIEIPIWR